MYLRLQNSRVGVSVVTVTATDADRDVPTYRIMSGISSVCGMCV